MKSIAFKTTRFVLDLLRKIIKANLRLYNINVIRKDHSIIFVVNHFTRVETVLLPHAIHKATGLVPWSLASGNLFFGRLGKYLHSVCTMSTEDPDRDRTIIRSLLTCENPWIIFPEGKMVKDKNLVDHEGEFKIYSKNGRRPPHTGAAVLALRAEYYRKKLECVENNPKFKNKKQKVLKQFDLDSFHQVKGFKTVIIPVNITYFPIRSKANLLSRVARALSKKLTQRSIEELSVEGTILSQSSDIAIRFGEPIHVEEYMKGPNFKENLACGEDDLKKLEANPRSVFNDAGRKLMLRYMTEIYNLTTINFDHIFASLIRYQKAMHLTERSYRNRIFLCVREILAHNKHPVHERLIRRHRNILFEDPSDFYEDFVQVCLKEGLLAEESPHYAKNQRLKRGFSDFHSVRTQEITYVIANEIEPLKEVIKTIKFYSRASRKEISSKIYDYFIKEDHDIFEKDYERFFDKKLSKNMDVGRPFLLKPEQIKAGVVLVHGYLAAPMEIRMLAQYLCEQGYIVYGVRLKGHGTSPDELAVTNWRDWYNSVNRGYAIIKSLTDKIILGGFSTGGALALMAAARKKDKIHSVFSINAPLELRNYKANLVPTIVSLNNILKKMRAGSRKWEFVKNQPENGHINYTMNPLKGMKQLGICMRAVHGKLKEICVPTLIVQGARDPVVDPKSGRMIFEKVGTKDKELVYLERDRHGIINGVGALDVFEKIHFFLNWAERQQEPEPKDWNVSMHL